MTVKVSLEPEHIESIGFALAALKAERAVCQRWGVTSVRHTLAVDDLEEIIDRADQARKQGEREAASSLLSLIGRSKPW